MHKIAEIRVFLFQTLGGTYDDKENVDTKAAERVKGEDEAEELGPKGVERTRGVPSGQKTVASITMLVASKLDSSDYR